MRSPGNVLIGVVLYVSLVLFMSLTAYAYIDPNAAGLISQVLTRLLVAATAGVTFFRKRIVHFFVLLSLRVHRPADV